MTTTTAPKETTIRIAIPTADGRLHDHFGGCQSLTVIATQTLPAPPHQPGAFPRWLREQGVRVVIAGGIGKRALDNFALHGIPVHAGEVNTRVEALVAAYLAGQSTGSPVGCQHHGHQHDHDHGHHHDHEGCDHGAERAH